jgi:putative NADH-flavin reductase
MVPPAQEPSFQDRRLQEGSGLRIAVLGGTGFAGRSVREHLESAGHQVRAFSRTTGCNLLDLHETWSAIDPFRPDVIVTRFPPQASGTHGHHTASAILAVEAFKVCGDAKAFPEQLAEGLKPWQPKRVLWNGGGTDLS